MINGISSLRSEVVRGWGSNMETGRFNQCPETYTHPSAQVKLLPDCQVASPNIYSNLISKISELQVQTFRYSIKPNRFDQCLTLDR